METAGKLLLLFGLLLVLFGGLLWGLAKLTGGRMLPGDIVIQRPSFTFAFPIVTSIVISLLLTFLLWLIGLLRR